MEIKQMQLEVIELLAQHEEAASEVYKTFAERFPDKRQFWTVLQLEELDHASWVRRLKPKIDEGYIYFNQERFKTEAIQESLERLKGALSKAKQETLRLKDALSIGMDIESSLIESNYYEVYDTDDYEFKQLLTALADAFREHRDRLKDALGKARMWDDST